MVEAESSIGVRISGPPKDFVKGSINNRPFRPGGLDDSQSLGRNFPEGSCNGEWVREVLDGAPAQLIPPSCKEGMDLGHLKVCCLRYHIHIIVFGLSLGQTLHSFVPPKKRLILSYHMCKRRKCPSHQVVVRLACIGLGLGWVSVGQKIAIFCVTQ